MERFKSITGKDIRIASTSGHIIVVGKDFTPIPDHLVGEAMANGLLAESVYLEAKKAVEREQTGGSPDPDKDAARRTAILDALSAISERVHAGKEVTPGGNKMMNNGKPMLAAVSELAGFEVKTADINAALED